MRKKHLLLALAGVAAIYGGNAMACTTQNWADNGSVLGTVVAAQPDDPEMVRRYSGFCGAQMNMDDGTAPGLRNDSPAAEPRYIARFYAYFDSATGTFDVFIGRDSGNAEQFSVTYGGGNLTGNAGGGSTSAVAVGPGWHSIEIDWQQGVGGNNGTFDMSVDGAAPVSVGGVADGATIDHVILGDADGAGGGTLNVDAFESHRSTAVGRLVVADANDDSNVNIVDASAIVAEVGGTLQSGQPDCNEDGVVNIVDASCVVALL